MSETEKRDPDGADPIVDDALLDAVRRRKARHEESLRAGEPSIGRRLAQIGVLGWIVVSPMLAGLFVGRWLDARLGTGIFWSAPLLILGLGLGGWVGWRWMKSQ